jgi:hypothetical protein
VLSYSNDNNSLGLPRALEVSGHQCWVGTHSTIQTGDGDGCTDQVEARGHSRYEHSEDTLGIGQNKP